MTLERVRVRQTMSWRGQTFPANSEAEVPAEVALRWVNRRIADRFVASGPVDAPPTPVGVPVRLLVGTNWQREYRPAGTVVYVEPKVAAQWRARGIAAPVTAVEASTQDAEAPEAPEVAEEAEAPEVAEEAEAPDVAEAAVEASPEDVEDVVVPERVPTFVAAGDKPKARPKPPPVPTAPVPDAASADEPSASELMGATPPPGSRGRKKY